MLTLEEKRRFWKKVDKAGRDECWTWLAFTHKGYGKFYLRGRAVRAHRVSFLIVYSAEPEVVAHKCDNPSCVNPRHLAGMTQAENVKDAMEKGRHSAWANFNLEHATKSIPLFPDEAAPF